MDYKPLKILFMRKAIALIASLLFVLSAFTQSTSLQCLTVGELNGAVTLKFSGPAGTDYFNIYRANQLDGSYQLIHTTANGMVDSYLDNTVNAASQSYAYYVESINNGQPTGVSLKNRTILLSVVDLSNGLVQLNWNDVGITTVYSYEIWTKGESGLFTLHNSSISESFIDSIESCPMTKYYQIRVLTNGCESLSNIRGGTYSDVTQPEPIIPQNASIDLNTGQILLSWLLPSEASADIIKYQVWIINEDGGSTSFPEAEVYGYNNLSLILENEFVCDTTLTFAITAQDSCGNNSNYDQEEYYIRTLNLKGAQYNVCNDECILEWDSIVGWYDLQLAGIRIFEKEGDGAFEQVAILGPTKTSVSLFGFERGQEYEFYIEAYSVGNIRTSTSCIRKITGRKPTVTAYNWLRQVSVINGEVKLKWQVDAIAYIPQFAISRSNDGLEYNIIDTVMGSEDTIHYFTDLESRYYQSPQYYYIQPFDSCLNLGEESNVSASIYAKVSPNGDGEALIEWTPYSLMDSLLFYNVYRVIDTNVYPIPIAELPPGELSYSDYYDNAVSLSSKVGYFVEAVGYFSDSITQADTARSNTNYLAKVINVFLPSGFKPKGGVSNIFKPIYTGIRPTNYSFKILNRWGMLIYESNQPVLGWNGKYNEELVMPGAYVYVLDYETIYGKKIRKSGIFYVLY